MAQATANLDPLHDVKLKVYDLFKAGLHYKQIAQELNLIPGTVKTWTRRAGLVTPRSESIASKAKPDQPSHNSQVKNNLGKALVKVSGQLDKLKAPVGAKAIALQAKTIQSVAEPAAIVFGWGQGQGSTTLLSIQSYTTGQIQDQDQVLDVDSEPIPDQLDSKSSTSEPGPEPKP